MRLQEQVELGPLTTLRVGGAARWFVDAGSEEELAEALRWAQERGIRAEVMGGGSNLLVADAGLDGLVVRLGMRGVKCAGEVLDVAAGEPWDGLVNIAGAAGLAGMECLAGIPGSVGATPVQNVGAYGQEVAQTVESVRVMNRQTGEFRDMAAAECGFRYRSSLFNKEERGRYVITRVRFRLRAGGAPSLAYADLQRWFEGRVQTPGLVEVAAAVRRIRAAKGMVLDEADRDTWSAGSYFKNPVVDAGVVERVAEGAGVVAGTVPRWAAGEGCVKLPAAWLLERAGFGRGYRMGAVGLSNKHALAVTNRGGATCADVLRLERAIRDGVHERFGVVLEREPVLLGDA